jgi:hypothetical protein
MLKLESISELHVPMRFLTASHSPPKPHTVANVPWFFAVPFATDIPPSI